MLEITPFVTSRPKNNGEIPDRVLSSRKDNLATLQRHRAISARRLGLHTHQPQPLTTPPHPLKPRYNIQKVASQTRYIKMTSKQKIKIY